MHVKTLPILLVYMTVRWYGECILLKQLEPPNGTSACPGDVIQLVCNTTFQNETTLTWQVIGGESQIIFKNIQDAFSGALQLPNGGNATWEAKTLSDNATGICTSSLTINASPDLHNVTIACCSENSPSPCNDLAAIPNDYKGIAVINISANSKCGDHSAPRNNTTLLKDHVSLHNLVWRITSPISLFVCTIALIFQIKEIIMLPTVTSEKKMELILIIDATAFAAISAFIQTFIYYLNNAAYCTVLGALFQVLLSCTIFIAVLLSLYLKFCNSSLNLKCSSLRPEYIIAVLAIAAAIAIVIAPVISGSYGDAGGWCWIKHTDGNAGIACQIITSLLGLMVALSGFVLAMMKCWKHRKTVMRCWKQRDDVKDYNEFLATAVCFLASFLVSNFISLVIALASGRPLDYLLFFHSIIYPLWPFVTTLPTIVRLLTNVQKCGKKLLRKRSQ